MKQALHLPSSGSEPKLLSVKIQNSLLPVSEVSVDDTAVAGFPSLTLSLRSGTQLCISQLTPDTAYRIRVTAMISLSHDVVGLH